MKILVFEGIDKSGKKTQSDTAAKYLESKGFKTYKMEFHNYTTETGKLIKKWLYGEYLVDQITIELLMAANKQEQQLFIETLEEKGYDYLVLDRYTKSQQVYSKVSSNFKDSKSVNYQLFISNLLKYIREPDYEILIDIPAEVSMSRKGQHGKNDRYESDLKLLEKVREEYIVANRMNLFADSCSFKVEGNKDMELVTLDVLNVIDRIVSTNEK